MQWDDLNMDLTASFRRFREQVLDAPSNIWATPSGMKIFAMEFLINFSYLDPSSTTFNPSSTNGWAPDLFPHGETNSFFESIKLASSGEINWNEIDVKPYRGKIESFFLFEMNNISFSKNSSMVFERIQHFNSMIVIN